MNSVKRQAIINDVKDEWRFYAESFTIGNFIYKYEAHYKTDKLVPVSEEEKIDIRYIINFII
jgi:hypothetical protein